MCLPDGSQLSLKCGKSSADCLIDSSRKTCSADKFWAAVVCAVFGKLCLEVRVDPFATSVG
jgi:hypothetical protein